MILYTWKTKNTNFFGHYGKKCNDRCFGQILFLPILPVIIQKMVKSKEHCSPTRSKTVFCFDILLKKGRKKTVATLTQVVPDDQSRNDQKNDQGRFKKWDYGFPGKNYIYR